MTSQHSSDPFSNVKPLIDGLLSGFGVATVSDHDTVISAVHSLLAERGLDHDVVTLRWNEIRVKTDPQTARLMSFDRNDIEDTLRTQIGNTELRFKVVSAR